MPTNFKTYKENRERPTLVTSEIELASANIPVAKREWLRISEATRCFGIGRSSLYELIAEGKIKSASSRKRGNVRGVRLVSADSLSNYIEGLVEPVAK